MHTQTIKIRHVKEISEFKALRDQWEVLFNQRTQKTVFLSWEWLYTWWKYNGMNKELWLLTAWHNDVLIGVAPLMLSISTKYGLRFRLLETLGSPNIDESDFLVKKGHEQAYTLFIEYIYSHKNMWDALKLNELHANSDSTKLIKNLLVDSSLINQYSTNQHYHIPINSSWEEYVKSLSKNTRDSITKRLRQAKKKYKFEFKYLKSEQIRLEHFEMLFEVNKKGRYSSVYNDDTERAFHKELFEVTKERNWVEIIMIFLDDQPVAFDYGFNLDGRFEDWRTGYDLSFRQQAVGKLLLYLSLEFQFTNGYRDFDFLRGDHDYKSQWNPLHHDYLNIIAVKKWHIPARLTLITLPKIWKWIKEVILRKKED